MLTHAVATKDVPAVLEIHPTPPLEPSPGSPPPSRGFQQLICPPATFSPCSLSRVEPSACTCVCTPTPTHTHAEDQKPSRPSSLPALCHGWSPVRARARAHPHPHPHTHMLKTRSPPVHLIPLLPLVSSRCPAEGQVQSRRCELASMESLFFCGPARPAGTEGPEAAPCLRVPYPGLIEWPWRSRRGSFSGR